jgi:hypothetical protein
MRKPGSNLELKEKNTAKGTITDGQVPVPPAMQPVASQPECRDAIRREDENWQVQAPVPSAR